MLTMIWCINGSKLMGKSFLYRKFPYPNSYVSIGMWKIFSVRNPRLLLMNIIFSIDNHYWFLALECQNLSHMAPKYNEQFALTSEFRQKQQQQLFCPAPLQLSVCKKREWVHIAKHRQVISWSLLKKLSALCLKSTSVVSFVDREDIVWMKYSSSWIRIPSSLWILVVPLKLFHLNALLPAR